MRTVAPRFLFMAAGAMALLGVGQPAAAGDSKVTGGSLCRKIGSQHSGVGATHMGAVRDGLTNSTQTKQKVACPLVRDSTDEPFTAVFARMLDAWPAGTAQAIPRCRIHGLSAGGTLSSSAWAVHSNPSTDGAFEFDSVSVVDTFDVALNGSASLECELGASDTILGLRWEEDPATLTDDVKVVAGSACYDTRSNPTLPAGFAHGSGWWNAPQLASGQRVVAECPIVRDTTSADLRDAYVRLILGSSGGQSATCTLTTRSVDGSFFENTPPESRSTDGSIHFAGDDMSHHAHAAYIATCSMPSNGRILSVRWDED